MSLRLLVFLALVLGVPLADALTPFDLLASTVSGRIFWLGSMFLVFLMGVQAVYRTRTMLEQLQDRITSSAVLPENQRKRVHRIKATAGALFHAVSRSQPDEWHVEKLLEDLREDARVLIDHELLMGTALNYSNACQLILAGKKGLVTEDGSPVDDVGIDITQHLNLLRNTANLVLLKHPPEDASRE